MNEPTITPHGDDYLTDGMTIDFGDGHVVEIPPHSQRVHIAIWRNGTTETLYYDEPVEGEDSSDRIHLMLTGFDGIRAGYLMNVEDAIAIIRGLSKGIELCIQDNVPTKPQEEQP